MNRLRIKIYRDGGLREIRRRKKFIEDTFPGEMKKADIHTVIIDTEMSIDDVYEILEQRNEDVFDRDIKYISIAYKATEKSVAYALMFCAFHSDILNRIIYRYDIAYQTDIYKLTKAGGLFDERKS